jgi:hypothetical protein
MAICMVFAMIMISPIVSNIECSAIFRQYKEIPLSDDLFTLNSFVASLKLTQTNCYLEAAPAFIIHFIIELLGSRFLELFSPRL